MGAGAPAARRRRARSGTEPIVAPYLSLSTIEPVQRVAYTAAMDVPLRQRCPDDDRFVEHLAPLVFALAERLHRHMLAAAGEVGLPPTLALALHRLDPSLPRPMSELAGQLACDPSYVTGIADGLEARGLAERRTAEHDRRVRVLRLTSAGEAARQRFAGKLAEAPWRIDGLSTADRTALLTTLRRLLNDDPAIADEAQPGDEDAAPAPRPEMVAAPLGPTVAAKESNRGALARRGGGPWG